MRTALGWAATLTLIAPHAYADPVVGANGDDLPVRDRHVFISYHEGEQVLIESIDLISTQSRALWMKPFPKEPERSIEAEDPFDALERATQVERPLNEQVRERVFGPSVVTLLSERLVNNGRKRTEAADPAEGPEPRTLEIADARFVTGAVYTSTITGRYVLPESLTQWLGAGGFSLSEAHKRTLAAHLNADWGVLFTVLRDPAPAPDRVARIGPVRFELETDQPTYPRLRRTGPGGSRPPHEIFVVGEEPLVPATYDTVWDERPWDNRSVPRGSFQTIYAHEIDPAGRVAYTIDERLHVTLPPQPTLVRSRFLPGSEANTEIEFEPAREAVTIPGGLSRGTVMDLFLCVLLGLTPLIYTPESWFLLWVGGRARDRARRGETAWGMKLWPIFAVAVAIYWVATLDGAARLAAALPFSIGVVKLALPFTEREKPRVRAQLAKKSKS